jgi:hypothetical protein
VTSDTGLAEKVKELGTEVIVDPTGSMGHWFQKQNMILS